MAACTRFICSHCLFFVDSWDDGNPYLTDSEGTRHFFYHPGAHTETRAFAEEQMQRPMTEEEFTAFCKQHSGNEGDYLCMECGRQTRRDPRHDSMRCTGCNKQKLRGTHRLKGRPCPKCRQGIFQIDDSVIIMS